jgi:hypothetical protein
LATGNGRRLQKLDPDSFRMIVVDEAHHTPASTYQAVLKHFGLVPMVTDDVDVEVVSSAGDLAQRRERYKQWWKSNWPHKLLLGVTATPNRGDSVGLEWTFNELVFERTIRWMVERGYLAQPVGHMIETGVDLDVVKTIAGDFNQGQLAQAVNTPRRNLQTVSGWQQRCLGRRSLAFTVDVQHAKDLCAAFRAAGVNAAWVSGDGGDALGGVTDRGYIIERFKAGAFDVLCNCNLLTEGFDDPGVGAIVMARPTKSQSLYMQMIGRGLRLDEGKADCIILDVVDTARRHSIVTGGDLFGLPKLWKPKGQSYIEQIAKLEAMIAAVPDVPLLPGMDLDAVAAKVKAFNIWQVSESDTANKFARLRWQELTPECFRIAIPSFNKETGAAVSGQNSALERMEIQQRMLGGWSICILSPNAITPVGEADDVQSAFVKAERYLEHTRPDAFRMRAKDAPWRDQPASEKQIALLTKLRAPVAALKNLTRGGASDMLDKYFASRKN